jgi:hypothetical protein
MTEKERIAKLFMDREGPDFDLPPVGALFPDMLRLLARWSWMDGRVTMHRETFRDETGRP